MGDDLLALFKERGAVLEGHFRLSSGLHSPRYVQCARVLMDPPLATRLGALLADALRPLCSPAPSAVVAPALGGVLVAHEVARAFGCRALFTERQDGAMQLRRGFELTEGEPVVVVEDAVTTGRSTGEVLEAVRARDARVLAVGSLVDRSPAPPEFGAPFRSLIRVEAVLYPPSTCPLCAEGSSAVKPGSRA